MDLKTTDMNSIDVATDPKRLIIDLMDQQLPKIKLK
jgi:hypothetical protein